MSRPVRVLLVSPFTGARRRNTEYALRCLHDSLERGEAPFAPHLLYQRVLDDEEPGQRDLGMAAGAAWLEVAEKVVAYIDHGVSDGMRREIAAATAAGIPVEMRSLAVRL